MDEKTVKIIYYSTIAVAGLVLLSVLGYALFIDYLTIQPASEPVVPAIPLNDTAAYVNFAKCLTSKGVQMYGAEWCPHCQREKQMFGGAFQFVTYHDCASQPEFCQSAGIEGYPTWVINGNKYPGEKTLEELSQMSGCALH